MSKAPKHAKKRQEKQLTQKEKLRLFFDFHDIGRIIFSDFHTQRLIILAIEKQVSPLKSIRKSTGLLC